MHLAPVERGLELKTPSIYIIENQITFRYIGSTIMSGTTACDGKTNAAAKVLEVLRQRREQAVADSFNARRAVWTELALEVSVALGFRE
jgi:hypothetical protein